MHTEEFFSNKIDKDIRIVVFSDIHYVHPGFNTKIFNTLYNEIVYAKPDYICIPGDIVDQASYSNLEELRDFFLNISKVAPVIVTFGNHDNGQGKAWSWYAVKNVYLREMLDTIPNLHLLEDSKFKVGNICFYGFNPSFDYYETTNESYDKLVEEISDLKVKLDENDYNVLLIHSPYQIYNYLANNPDSELNKCDLVLSGHMHNGTLPYFFTHLLNSNFKTNRSLINPVKKWFADYCQGKVYKVKDGYIHDAITKFSVSSGILHYIDFMYRKHVTVLDIKKTDH